MEPTYRHTQKNITIAVVLALLALPLLLLVMETSAAWIPIGLFVFVAVTFSSLTTEVYSDRILIWFGPGWIRKTIRLEEVKGVESVRNKWYYGFGIRYIGNGWMYNVSGLDAVELQFTSGKRFRIGTDQPRELEEAIWKQLPDLTGAE